MSGEPKWIPTSSYIKETRLYQWMKKLGFDDYDAFLNASTDDIAWFWKEAEKALGIEWFHPYTETVNLSQGIPWPKWYVGGKLNVVHNAVHKWAEKENTKDAPALKWEGEDGEVRAYTYQELKKAIAQAASGLRQLGLQKGDVVTLYMPMIPETVIAMMAISQLGAIFSPTFSGYGAEAVATRMNASESKMLITADGFLRRGKAVPMKKEADEAARRTPTLEKMIVIERLGSDVSWDDKKDVAWSEMMKTGGASPTPDVASLPSDAPMMLIYTSGTTGTPKGTVHTHAGFPIKSAFDAGMCMDVRPGDTLFWFTDMGWMMGPFLVYGSLLNGASLLMYEGSPDYPAPDRLWQVTSDHEVTHVGISPTLIRSLMKHGEEHVTRHSLSRLKAMASTGEPWNPEPWKWLFETVGKSRIPIINYSGGTEISGGILGNVLVKPITPITFNTAIPGMAAAVYNEEGKPVTGEVGELVLTKPWVGMTNGFWKEKERYENTYWSRFPDVWVHGHWAIQDEEGYWTITGRSDDILNIAGKRLGPAEMESALVEHEAVREAGTIGIPHDVKGEEAICFVVLQDEYTFTDELEKELIALCGEKLGKALRPSAIFPVDDLPKTRNAKVMRRAIKAAFLNKNAGDLSSLENPEAVEHIRQLGKTFKKTN